MTVPNSTIQRVRAFVKKYNNNQLEWKKDLNSNQQEILKALVNAVDLFEMAEEERKPTTSIYKITILDREVHNYKYSLTITASNLNKLIKMAEINEMYIDLTKEDSPELKNMKRLNGVLASQNNQLKKILEQIFNEYTAIRQKFEPMLNSIKIEESKVE